MEETVRHIAAEDRCTLGEALRDLLDTHPRVRITFTKIVKRTSSS